MKKRKKGKIKKTGNKTILMIVKRKGHTEIYDERKVYGSCYFACRNAHLSEKEAEEICNKVAAEITKWIKKKKLASSDEIFRALINELSNHNKDAAFLYETHRDIS
ncbi:hypothetical protein HYS31_06570 [Candidatus Woesearchaeota archaeon]|nr:hypothetical protein [Candidatus Woesearchaeota archaeon]